MQDTKSSISITIDLFIRALSATACIFILMFMLWILRAIVSDIPLESLRVDDPIWLSLFLSIWFIIPAIPAYIAQIIKSKKARGITYFSSAMIQTIALYFAVNYMAQQPHSEIGSSIFPMLVWVSIPLAALYYQLFFNGLNKNKIRIKLILVTLFLIPLWLI